MKEISIEDCIRLKEKFSAYCERAGQHEFVHLLRIDLLMDKSIEDWSKHGVDQYLARIMFRVVLTSIGENCREYEDEEWEW